MTIQNTDRVYMTVICMAIYSNLSLSVLRKKPTSLTFQEEYCRKRHCRCGILWKTDINRAFSLLTYLCWYCEAPTSLDRDHVVESSPRSECWQVSGQGTSRHFHPCVPRAQPGHQTPPSRIISVRLRLTPNDRSWTHILTYCLHQCSLFVENYNYFCMKLPTLYEL